jgi:hypothetical protein
METKLLEALISMGYREMSDGIYGKPVCRQLLMYKLSTNRMALIYNSASTPGGVETWSSVNVNGVTAVDVMNAESNLMESFSGYRGNQAKTGFSFLSAEEQATLVV